MHNVDGPRVPMRDCCPGLVRMNEMSEVRVEAITDFSGVEYVFCSDKEIRREHFPEEEWVTVQCQNPSLSLTLRATVLVVTYTS